MNIQLREVLLVLIINLSEMTEEEVDEFHYQSEALAGLLRLQLGQVLSSKVAIFALKHNYKVCLNDFFWYVFIHFVLLFLAVQHDVRIHLQITG